MHLLCREEPGNEASTFIASFPGSSLCTCCAGRSLGTRLAHSSIMSLDKQVLTPQAVPPGSISLQRSHTHFHLPFHCASGRSLATLPTARAVRRGALFETATTAQREHQPGHFFWCRSSVSWHLCGMEGPEGPPHSDLGRTSKKK